MQSLPSFGRLFVFAVLLPAIVAGSNQLLFDLIRSHPGLRAWLYPWMTISTAIMSWCVGRYLQPAWLCWIVFGWSLALLDLLTVAACIDHRIEEHFGFVLVSAQISLVVLWAILGPIRWQWRLPGALVAVPIVIAFSDSFALQWDDGWNVLMVLTAVVVTILGGMLRWRGFVLRPAQFATPNSEVVAAVSAHQFGLKHMLVWSTAIVPLLLAIPGFNFLLFSRPLGDMESALAGIFIALSLAMVNLAAIWCVLGGGAWYVRVLMLLVVTFVVAVCSTIYSAHLITKYGTNWLNVAILDTLIDMRQHWIAWIGLNAALLAALLLFLRARGFRLMRNEITPAS